jgi:hypothetical protein
VFLLLQTLYKTVSPTREILSVQMSQFFFFLNIFSPYAVSTYVLSEAAELVSKL